MRYNELTKEDLQNIRDVYKDSSLTSQQAIDELSENFDVSTRTIRNWLDLMRLSGVKKPKNKKWNISIDDELKNVIQNTVTQDNFIFKFFHDNGFIFNLLMNSFFISVASKILFLINSIITSSRSTNISCQYSFPS